MNANWITYSFLILLATDLYEVLKSHDFFYSVSRKFESRPTRQLYKSPLRNIGAFLFDRARSVFYKPTVYVAITVVVCTAW